MNSRSYNTSELNEMTQNQIKTINDKYINININNQKIKYDDKIDVLSLSNEIKFSDSFINSTIEENKTKTPEDRAEEIQNQFKKIRKDLSRYLTNAKKYKSKIDDFEEYEATGEGHELKNLMIEQNEKMQTYFNEVIYLLNKQLPNDEAKKEQHEQLILKKINKLFKAFETVFNCFIKRREHYKPFLSTTDPTAFKTVSDIFRLKGIDFKENKRFWLICFNKIINKRLFNCLLINLGLALDEITDKTIKETRQKFYKQFDLIDLKTDEFAAVVHNIKPNILNDLLKIDENVHKITSGLNDFITEEEEKENLIYEKEQREKAANTIFNNPIIQNYIYIYKDILKGFHMFSHKEQQDHQEETEDNLIKDYQKLLKYINKLFKDNFI